MSGLGWIPISTLRDVAASAPALGTGALILVGALMLLSGASLLPPQARAHSPGEHSPRSAVGAGFSVSWHSDALLSFRDTTSSWLKREQLLARAREASTDQATADTTSFRGRPPALCGPDDEPESGLQGQTPLADMLSGRSQEPYFCGVRLVGHSDIWNRGNNLQLARSQRCAYVSTAKALFPQDPEDPVTTREPAGVAVIDVRDPRKPTPVGLLRDPGSLDTVETMDAIDAGERHVLVAGEYSGGGGVGGNGPAALSIYDVSNCAEPKLMANFYWPRNVHDLTLSPDGKRIYASRPPNAGDTGFMVLDITNMRTPRLIANAPLILPDGSPTGCHTVEVNRQETRLYCAGFVSSRAEGDGKPNYFPQGGPTIWDISEISNGEPNPEAHFVGESALAGQGWHHAVPARVNGRRYMIAASELAISQLPTGKTRPDCNASAFPRIWDLSDERRPRVAGEFRLQVQDHCDDPGVQEENALGHYATHYNNVDDPWGDTRLGLFGWTAAGVRIVDLRDPSRPREVAYFKPGANPITTLQPAGAHISSAYYNANVTDACMSRNTHIEETGEIWFVCQSNGFYVVQLSPEVRAYMGLNSKPAGAGAQASPQAAQALQCPPRRLVLADVVPSRRRVRLVGYADRRYVARTVTIVFGPDGRRVARAKLRPDGSFRASAPLPPMPLRASSRARYQARIGRQRSRQLKLMRRMRVTNVRVADRRVTISGRIAAPLARPVAPVQVRRRISCGRWEVVGQIRPSRTGRFRTTVDGPPSGQAATYRLATRVRPSVQSRRLVKTFTLPIYVDLA